MNEAIVSTHEEAGRLEHGAALILDPLREYLDALGFGTGDLRATAIGGGHSNLTFLLQRGEDRVVLRRPPRGDLSASANDVLRESRILEAVAETELPVPRVIARCADSDIIGAPFFLMDFIDGIAVDETLPRPLDGADAPRRIGENLIDRLLDLHRSDLESTGLARFGKSGGYLDRQLRRFGSLLEENATRDLPDLDYVGDWLLTNVPATTKVTFVHGDYRLGNVLFDTAPRICAVLDWEMATIGDPLADLGYCTAMWTEPQDRDNPMFELSPITRRGDFPGRRELAARYAEGSPLSVDILPWYQVFALWKSAIFLESSYRRFVAGASTDAFFASLDSGVPAIAATARDWIAELL